MSAEQNPTWEPKRDNQDCRDAVFSMFVAALVDFLRPCGVDSESTVPQASREITQAWYQYHKPSLPDLLFRSLLMRARP